MNRRRPPPQSSSSSQHQNGNPRRARPIPTSNPRRNGLNNSEPNNTYRRPRPATAAAQAIVPPISN